MAGEPAVVDASVLIAHLNREEGRADRSRELLEDAEGGQIQLWARRSSWWRWCGRHARWTAPNLRRAPISSTSSTAHGSTSFSGLGPTRGRNGAHGSRSSFAPPGASASSTVVGGGSGRTAFAGRGVDRFAATPSRMARAALRARWGVVLERVWQVCRVAARYRPCGQPVHLILVRLRQQPPPAGGARAAARRECAGIRRPSR